MNQFTQDRQNVLDHISENYSFGNVNVVAMDGWMTETPGFEYVRPVYLENLADPEGDSEMVYLTVLFESKDSVKLKEVYAIDAEGNHFGNYTE